MLKKVPESVFSFRLRGGLKWEGREIETLELGCAFPHFPLAEFTAYAATINEPPPTLDDNTDRPHRLASWISS